MDIMICVQEIIKIKEWIYINVQVVMSVNYVVIKLRVVVSVKKVLKL